MSILGHSSQSTRTRTAILASIYLLVLACLPLARKLVAVERLPYDESLLKTWSKTLDDGRRCPLLVPAAVRLEYSEGHRHLGWATEVAQQAQRWLTDASEHQTSFSSVPEESRAAPWCVRWHVSVTPLAAAGHSETADFAYNLEDARFRPLDSQPLHSFPASSVALTLVQRIAVDLDLPFKFRLLTGTQEAASTVSMQQPDEAKDPVPQPSPDSAAVRTQDSRFHDVAPSPSFGQALAHMPSLANDTQIAAALSQGGGSSIADAGVDTAISLPSRLVLSFHVLNEDVGTPEWSDLTPALVAPLTAFANSSGSAFVTRLQSTLEKTAQALAGVTDINVETHWAVGARTQGVNWESIQWTVKEEHEEWIETEDVRDEEEGTGIQNASASAGVEIPETRDEETEDQLLTGTRRRTIATPVSVWHTVNKTVHSLSADQLEIFVNEGAWGLEEQTSHGRRDDPSGRSARRNKGRTSDARDLHQTRTLRLVLYNPSEEHSPLIYLPDGVHGNPKSDAHLNVPERSAEPGGLSRAESSFSDAHVTSEEATIALAVAQHANPVQWGWSIPGWGGVVIFNDKQALRDACASGTPAPMLCPLPAHRMQEAADLWAQQVNSILGLASALTEKPGSHQQRVAQFDLLRRTLLSRVSDGVESLAAFHRVTEHLRSLEIGEDVRRQVQSAISGLDRLDAQLKRSSESGFFDPSGARRAEVFDLAADIASYSSLAFHHPRMLGLLYFPAEHNWAVYTPLFGPLAVPLILAGLKELRRWRRKRRARHEPLDKGEKDN
ncbi:unnamed protein product [Parajaminaea phylloscopi]